MNTSTFAKAIAAAALAIAGSAQAATTVIDFEAVSNTGFPYLSVGSSYTEDGFKLTTGGGLVNALFAPSTDNALLFAGSTAAFGGLGTTVKLARVDGTAFNFNSIELSKLSFANVGGNTVKFTGNFIGGGSTSATVTLGTGFGLSTFNSFAGFTNLKSVTWTESYNLGKDYQFDNINVSAVPEPETYAMLGAGLGLLAFASRRKKTA